MEPLMPHRQDYVPPLVPRRKDSVTYMVEIRERYVFERVDRTRPVPNGFWAKVCHLIAGCFLKNRY